MYNTPYYMGIFSDKENKTKMLQSITLDKDNYGFPVWDMSWTDTIEQDSIYLQLVSKDVPKKVGPVGPNDVFRLEFFDSTNRSLGFAATTDKSTPGDAATGRPVCLGTLPTENSPSCKGVADLPKDCEGRDAPRCCSRDESRYNWSYRGHTPLESAALVLYSQATDGHHCTDDGDWQTCGWRAEHMDTPSGTLDCCSPDDRYVYTVLFPTATSSVGKIPTNIPEYDAFTIDSNNDCADGEGCVDGVCLGRPTYATCPMVQISSVLPDRCVTLAPIVLICAYLIAQ